MKNKITVPGILRITGIVLVFIGIFTQISNMMKMFKYRKDGGEIIRIEEGSQNQDSHGYTGYRSSKVYYARYTVDGVEYENRIYPPYGGGYEGMEVTVEYDPNDPSKIIYDENGMSVSQAAPLAAGVILMALGTSMGLNRKRKYITNR